MDPLAHYLPPLKRNCINILKVKLQECERGVKSPKSIEKMGSRKSFHKANKNMFSYSFLRHSLVCDQAISHWSWQERNYEVSLITRGQGQVCVHELANIKRKWSFYFLSTFPLDTTYFAWVFQWDKFMLGLNKAFRVTSLFLLNNPNISILDWQSAIFISFPCHQNKK